MDSPATIDPHSRLASSTSVRRESLPAPNGVGMNLYFTWVHFYKKIHFIFILLHSKRINIFILPTMACLVSHSFISRICYTWKDTLLKTLHLYKLDRGLINSSNRFCSNIFLNEFFSCRGWHRQQMYVKTDVGTQGTWTPYDFSACLELDTLMSTKICSYRS